MKKIWTIIIPLLIGCGIALVGILYGVYLFILEILKVWNK